MTKEGLAMIHTHYNKVIGRNLWTFQARRKHLESGKAKSGCGLFVGVWGRCFNLTFLAVSFFSVILQNCKYQRAYACISNIQSPCKKLTLEIVTSEESGGMHPENNYST